MVLAQNHGFGADVPGFGPDVVILGVLRGNPRKWVESLFMLPALPVPGRSPFNTSIAQLGVHPHLTTTAIIYHYIGEASAKLKLNRNEIR